MKTLVLLQHISGNFVHFDVVVSLTAVCVIFDVFLNRKIVIKLAILYPFFRSPE